MAKKTSFFFIILELIEIFLIVNFFEIFDLDCSSMIFNFKSFDKDLFLSFIEFIITFWSEKNNFLFP